MEVAKEQIIEMMSTAYLAGHQDTVEGDVAYCEQGSREVCEDIFESDFEQRLQASLHKTIVKCPLPDVFEGDLNTRRIKKYQEIKKQYMVSEGTVRELFNAGIYWYKDIVEESGT